MSEDKGFDICPFHMVTEHKLLMLARIRFLEQKGHLLNAKFFQNKYKELEDSTLKIRNLIIKWPFTKNTNILSPINDNFLEITESEAEVLGKMIDHTQT